jgi:hypothetical protein
MCNLSFIPPLGTQNSRVHQILAKAYGVEARNLFHRNIKDSELAHTYIQIARLMDDENCKVKELFDEIKYERGAKTKQEAQAMFDEGVSLVNLGRGYFDEALIKFQHAIDLDISFA